MKRGHQPAPVPAPAAARGDSGSSTAVRRLDPAGLSAFAMREALAAGFSTVAIASLDDFGSDPGRGLDAFLAAGHHGDMAWLAEHAERRRHPNVMWAEARSAIVVGASYAPDRDPLTLLGERERGVIALYAQRKDYHDVVKARLKRLARCFAAAAGADVKVFVDTAPLMEKPLAALAGLGWQGKHTNLVSREAGSWLLLGTVLTTAELKTSAGRGDHCGTCRRCLDICPTGAFPAPYQLDARRCISYLTIEHRGPIPRALRAGIGNRIFGCDDCLAVCPWNKFAVAASDTGLARRSDLDGPMLADLIVLDDVRFRALFAGTSIKRTGHARFLRNVLIAAGNSGAADLAPLVADRLESPSPLVRGAAVWALSQLVDRAAFAALAVSRRRNEPDRDVQEEWEAALVP